MSSLTPSNAVSPVIVTNPSAFDSRLVEVDIQFATQTLTFSDLAIYATGQKFGTAIQNSCDLTIFNLTAEQRNYILTNASPLNRNRNLINVNLRVGRQSYGTFLLYTGNMISCNVLQPPDIGITLKSLTGNLVTGLSLGFQQPAITLLSQIINSIAAAGGWTVDNETTDKQINNFSFTGSPWDGVRKLNLMGGIHAFVENNVLVVLNIGTARRGVIFQLNETTGMVGIPQVTEQGILVKMMINNAIQIGGGIQLTSITNPAANGNYKIMKIFYDVASRDQPFFYTLECSNFPYLGGTQ